MAYPFASPTLHFADGDNAAGEPTSAEENPSNGASDRNGFIWAFIPRKEFLVTPLLIDINILIFVAMIVGGADVMNPTVDTLVEWGANFRPSTVSGQWWRLFTCCFLHFGIIHLLMNMYALFYIGKWLEPLVGTVNFTVCYILTGILSSAASLYWHSLTVSAGASGAIFGMYGVFFAMLTTDLIERSSRRTLLISISVFIAYNLVAGLGNGIDNAAHIGGLISGLTIGYILYPILSNTYSIVSTSVVIGVLTAATFLISFYAYRKSPDELVLYQRMMKDFEVNESLALEIYQQNPQDTARDHILYEIQTRAIYYWNLNLGILEKIDRFSLPEQFKTRNKVLQKYSHLRIENLNFVYKAISQRTDKFKPDIERTNKQIEQILHDIKSENEKYSESR